MNIRKYRKEIVFLLDLLIVTSVNSFLYMMLPSNNGLSYRFLLAHLTLLIICGGITQYFFRTYDSLWRYAESKEYLTLLVGGITGYISYFAISHFFFRNKVSMLFTLSGYSVSLLFMLLMRFSYRIYRKRGKFKKHGDRIPLVIIGAGEAGVKLQEELRSNPGSRYKTLCFIDDSIEKIGKYIHNIEVKGPISDIERLISDLPVNEIVIAIPSLTSEKRKNILRVCTSMGCQVKILPDTLTLLQQENSNSLWKNVRNLRIEELLGREEIIFDDYEVTNFLQNKVVLVTGGGGSIGSELCRQIAKVQPKRLIIFDIYENNAYEIQQELLQIYGDRLDLVTEIGSIRDKCKVNLLFEKHRPNIVFHAAAHKHVPLMEECPEEAIKNNIFGTYHMVQAADCYLVEKFVLISTDKAVNPTNVMGASKRFCEMLIQSMKEVSKTEYVAVRFGNVLGSNGSVIPLFQKQIAQGGPVTITDKRIVRYFMTIHEAVQLVLQAGAMANSSEIYVLDMGEPVKILELAENLIRLSGHLPHEEIQITETGLRPGEKLYEELLMSSKELKATHKHKIYIEFQKEITFDQILEYLELLKSALETNSSAEIKVTLKQIVPSYLEPEEVNAKYHPEENSKS